MPDKADSIEKLSWATNRFLNAPLEAEFQHVLYLRTRRLFLRAMVISVLGLGATVLASTRDFALVILLAAIAVGSTTGVVAAALPVDRFERHFKLFVRICLVILDFSIVAVGFSLMHEEAERVNPGETCDDRSECVGSSAIFGFYSMVGIAGYASVEFVEVADFSIHAGSIAVLFFVATILYYPANYAQGVVVVLLFFLLQSVVMTRVRHAHLTFLLLRELEGRTISVQRDALFSFSKQGAGKRGTSFAARPNWLIDASDIEKGRLLGQGAFGRVFVATWKGVSVAVKELITDGDDESAMDEFLKEVQILSGLRHPNILLFMGVAMEVDESDHRNLLLVTEFMDKGSLSDLLAEQGATIATSSIIALLMDAARGLQYLHNLEPPLIHRDIKPQNMLISKSMVVKICDFGLSPETKGTSAHQVGTTFYMSPEALSNASDATTAGDVFAFAVVMWEAAAGGKTPYEDELINRHQLALTLDIVNSNLRPNLDFMRPSIPAEYRELVQAGWAHEPRSRPTIAQVLSVLESIDVESLDPTSFDGTSAGIIMPMLEGSLYVVRCEIAHAEALWIELPNEIHQASLVNCKALGKLAGEFLVDVSPAGVIAAFPAAARALSFCVDAFEKSRELPIPEKLCAHPLLMDSHLPLLVCIDHGEVGRRKQGKAIQNLSRIAERLTHDGSIVVMTEAARMQTATALHDDGWAASQLQADGIDLGLYRLWHRAIGMQPADDLAASTTSSGLPIVLPGQPRGSIKMLKRAVQSLVVGIDQVHVGNAIGKGPTGTTVHRATLHGEPVAIKKLAVKKLTLEQASQLQHEAAIARALQHPNVYQILGVCLRGDYAIIMRRYVGSLVDEIQKKKSTLTPERRAAISNDVARGLGVLHSKSIRHKNLRASNVLFTEDGTAVVADFGLDKVRAAAATITSIDSATHLAPEILLGKEEIGLSADVWSLGILRLQMERKRIDLFGEGKKGVLSVVNEITAGTVDVATADSVTAACLQVLPDKRADVRDCVE